MGSTVRYDVYANPITELSAQFPCVLEIQSDRLYAYSERVCLPLARPGAFPGMNDRLNPSVSLLPVGVDYRRERDVELFGLDAGGVLARMEQSGAALSLMILDACRDSPLSPEGRTTASRGLGRMEAHSGSLVAFATAPGRTADENRAGRNGLYTQYLLRAIETTGLRLEDVFQQVRRDVERASNRRQSPEEISKLTSAFFFRPAVGVAAAPTLVPALPGPAAAQGGGVTLADLEREAQARRQWAEWQQRMQADFAWIAGFQEAADLRVQA
jgi:hypothetical protein